MKSFTVEDVCSRGNHDYEDLFDEMDVIPNVSYDECRTVSLNKKLYFVPGKDTCAICLDVIKTQKTGYLTNCSHAFHKKCLVSMFDNKFKKGDFKTPQCPCCRHRLTYHVLDSCRMYNMNKNYTSIDACEEWEHCGHLFIPRYCYIKKNNIHVEGIQKDCRCYKL